MGKGMDVRGLLGGGGGRGGEGLTQPLKAPGEAYI